MVFVALGLGSRRFGEVLPGWVAAYAGDTLWGVMWFVAAVVIVPHARPSVWAAVSLAWTWGIEISQLYQSPWIDAVRRTLVGRYLLGNTFLWSDMVCCAVGVALAWVVVVAAKAFVVGSKAIKAAR